MFGRFRIILLNGFVAQIATVLAFLSLFVYLDLRDYAHHDFVCYWAASHQLLNGSNPYDSSAIQQIERSLGFSEGGPAFIVRNPPWALPLIAPLARFSVRTAILLWATFMLALAGISCWMLTRESPGKRDLLIYFVPLIICLWNGQSTTIVLFAVSFFLCFNQKWPFASGLALSLAIVKPHLLLIFWPIFILDYLRRRQWRPLLGLLCGTLLLTGIAFWLDPHAWAQYRLAMDQQGIGSQFLPNVSAELRFLLLPHQPWFQFLPSLVGLVAALVIYLKSSHWNWSEQGALLIGVSAVLSPYSWTYDLALVLPAVLTLPATEKVRQCVCLASLMTLLPFEFTRKWASPWMSLAGIVWVAWYLFARYTSSGEPHPLLDPAIG